MNKQQTDGLAPANVALAEQNGDPSHYRGVKPRALMVALTESIIEGAALADRFLTCRYSCFGLLRLSTYFGCTSSALCLHCLV